MKEVLRRVEVTAIAFKTAKYDDATYSGGDAALGWSAASLDDGSVLTLTTNGDTDFGDAPSNVVQLGFGKGWMYQQPLLTVLTNQDMDGIVVSEGGARRIEEVDGIRALASRIRDAAGWAGYVTAGRNISAYIGPQAPGKKVCAIQMYKLVSQTEPLNWQVKNLRGQKDPTTTDQPDEWACFGWRDNPSFTVADAAGDRTSNYNTVQPHFNFGWQTYAVGTQMSSPDTADGAQYTMLFNQDSSLHMQHDGGAVKLDDSGAAGTEEYRVWQDYVDGSNGTAYEPENVDLYLTNIQVQQDSFWYVLLMDAPTITEATNAVLMPTVLWGASQIKVIIDRCGRTWPACFAAIYNLETNTISGSVLFDGSYTPPSYDRWADAVGVYRKTVNSIANFISIPSVNYDPAVDTKIITAKIGITSYEGYTAGVPVNTVLSCNSTSVFRDQIVFNTTGTITLRSTNNISLTFSNANIGIGNHLLRFTFSPSAITLEEWNSGTNSFDVVDSVTRGTFDTYKPNKLLAGGSSVGFNGTLYNWMEEVNSVVGRG